MHIFALHGFLGKPSDWNILHPLSLPVTAVDIVNPQTSTSEWAHNFNNSITTTDNILFAYSLGGRLALHALTNNPSKWKAAIIISANPGLKSIVEREQRLKHDSQWVNRFENDSWEPLMQDWNQQPVFGNRVGPHRSENDYLRIPLSQMLTHWSLGHQEDLSDHISKLDLPILWITGEEDEKYCQLAKQQHFFHPLSRLWIAQNAGHRVPWELTNEFIKQSKFFLEQVQECV